MQVCSVSVLFQKLRPRKLVTGCELLASRSMHSSMKVGTWACRVTLCGIDIEQACSFVLGQYIVIFKITGVSRVWLKWQSVEILKTRLLSAALYAHRHTKTSVTVKHSWSFKFASNFCFYIIIIIIYHFCKGFSQVELSCLYSLSDMLTW